MPVAGGRPLPGLTQELADHLLGAVVVTLAEVGSP
jgi:hypothetical protein